MIHYIRNFVIVAHINHGKSTLADRFLELTGAVEKRKMREQFLDQMELERERGITIKLQPVRMSYLRNGVAYQLNLIDTPGHVDFTYEVSRSLAAVEGAILLVDATQGIQAQTLANYHLAKKQGLKIIPVINKIDLTGARIDETAEEIKSLTGVLSEEILKISAKTGEGVSKILESVINLIPAPAEKDDSQLAGNFPRALIFDSAFDAYKGVIAYVRIFNGQIKTGDKINFFASQAQSRAEEVGYFTPELKAESKLSNGEIGYIATGLKNPALVRVGDSIFEEFPGAGRFSAVPGYQEPKPVVFASFYPQVSGEYNALKDALMKLKLMDASLSFEPESSPALGRGFRLGFLGMLHVEIVNERLRREFNLALIVSSPSVAYRVTLRDGRVLIVRSASLLPDAGLVEKIEEPVIDLEILTQPNYLGAVMELLSKHRSQYLTTQYFAKEVAVLKYRLPLAEIITDFYDRLKSVSSGYASLNYESAPSANSGQAGYQAADLVRLDILVAGESIEPFSKIVLRQRAYHEGRRMVEKLKKLIPRQLFAVSLQAAVGGRIIARQTLSPMRKDVTGYLYGGDVTRKMKLLEKQKLGKAKLKREGRVKIPQKVFLEILRK